MKYYISAPSPIKYSLAEANALIFASGLSQDTYQLLRNQAKKRRADIYPVYNHLLEYRKEECTPRGIVFEDTTVYAPLQEVLDHQLRKMFDDPIFYDRVSAIVDTDPIPTPLDYIIKLGYDGFSHVSIILQTV